MTDQSYNFAYLDEDTKRMIRRAILKGIAVPGYQVPFASREMPMPYGWGTGGVQVTAATLVPDDVNPYESAAVAVFLAGRMVGYLSPKAAVTFREHLKRKEAAIAASLMGEHPS